jgi:hypothetical protein
MWFDDWDGEVRWMGIAYRDCIVEPIAMGAAKLLKTIREANEGWAPATVTLLAQL